MKTLFIAGAALIVGAMSGPMPQQPFRLAAPPPSGVECSAASVTIRIRAVETGLSVAIERRLAGEGFTLRLV